MEEQKNITKERQSFASENIQSSFLEKIGEQQQQSSEGEKKTSKSLDSEVKKNKKKSSQERKSQLLAWKAEKDKKKSLEAKKKKPTFQIFGGPRHKYYSPPTRVLPNRLKMKNKKRVSGNPGEKSSKEPIPESPAPVEPEKSSVEEPESSKVQDSSSTSSQVLEAAPKKESKEEKSSGVDDKNLPQTPTTADQPKTPTGSEYSSSSSCSISTPMPSPSDTSTLSMETPGSSTLRSTSNSTKTNDGTTGPMHPILAKVHQAMVFQENKNLQDIRNDWIEMQQEYELPADDIRYINSVIGQMNFLIRRESTRFHNAIAGYQAGVQVFIRGRDYPHF